MTHFHIYTLYISYMEMFVIYLLYWFDELIEYRSVLHKYSVVIIYWGIDMENDWDLISSFKSLDDSRLN